MGKSPGLLVLIIGLSVACGVMGAMLVMRPSATSLPSPTPPSPTTETVTAPAAQPSGGTDGLSASATPVVAPAPTTPPKSTPQSGSDLAKQFTVGVLARASQGTGFAIAPNLILTSQHIVGDERVVTLVLADKSRVKAEVIKADATVDCALIYSPKRLTVVAQTDPSAPAVGASVFVYGHPEGLDGTLSNGIVSGLRSVGDGPVAAIQITAPISHGSSGGPLFLPDGKVIGIIQATIADGQNLNFALPIAKGLAPFTSVLESWTRLGQVRDELATLPPGRDVSRVRALLGKADAIGSQLADTVLMNECRLIAWAQENVASEISTVDLVRDLLSRVIRSRLSSADGALSEAELGLFKKELDSLGKYGLRGGLLDFVDDGLENQTFLSEVTPLAPGVADVVKDARAGKPLSRSALLEVYRSVQGNQPFASDCLLFAHLLRPAEVEAAVSKIAVQEIWSRALSCRFTQPLCSLDYATGPRVLFRTLAWLPVKDEADYRKAVTALSQRILDVRGNPGTVLKELGFLQEFGIGGAADAKAAAGSYRGAALFGVYEAATALARLAFVADDAEVRKDLAQDLAGLLESAALPRFDGNRIAAAQAMALGLGPQLRMDDVFALVGELSQRSFAKQFSKQNARRIVEQLAALSHPKASWQVGLSRYTAGNKPDAVDFFKRAAAGGDGAAASQLGYMYGTGDGIPKDETQGRSYTKAAAELGDPTGQFNLGLDLVEQKKVTEGRALIERASKNFPPATIWLARDLARGPSGIDEKVRALVVSAFRAGNPDAIAIMFRFATAVPPPDLGGVDPSEILSSLTYQAASGNAECLEEYNKLLTGDSLAARAAKHYFELHSLPKRENPKIGPSRDRLIGLLIEEARKDNPYALRATYDLVARGYETIDQRARAILLPMCAQRFPKRYSAPYAESLLKQISEGDLIAKSSAAVEVFARALKVLEAGAAAGDSAAKVHLALILEFSVMGTPRDHQRAIDLLTAAGNDGNLDALKILTAASAAGDLLPRDREKAQYYWRQVMARVSDYQYDDACDRLRSLGGEPPKEGSADARAGVDFSKVTLIRALSSGSQAEAIQGARGLVMAGIVANDGAGASANVRICDLLTTWPHRDSARAYYSERQVSDYVDSDFSLYSSWLVDAEVENGTAVLKSLNSYRTGGAKSWLEYSTILYSGAGVPADKAAAYDVLARMGDRGERIAKLYAVMVRAAGTGNVDRAVGDVKALLQGGTLNAIFYDDSRRRAGADYLLGRCALLEGDRKAAALAFQRAAANKHMLAAISMLLIKPSEAPEILTPECRAQTVRALTDSIAHGTIDEAFELVRPRQAALPTLSNAILADAVRRVNVSEGAAEEQFLRALAALFVTTDQQTLSQAHDRLRALGDTYDPAAVVLGGLYFRGYTITADAALAESIFSRVKQRSPGTYDALISAILADKGTLRRD